MILQRCHDYHYLIRRWRAVCAASGLKIKKCGTADGYQCYEIFSPLLTLQGGIYISAGIHGDEPASCSGLIDWAEQHVTELAELPLLIYPCLNPWGLVNNNRNDAGGTDLNRVWESPATPFISYIIERIRNYQFDLALTLHEDFDGQGLYIYEPVPKGNLRSWGAKLIAAAAPFLPADPRKTIDGRRAKDGMIRPAGKNLPFSELPEAVYLHLHHAQRTYTFETPSEYGLDRRTAAQAALVKSAIEMTLRK